MKFRKKLILVVLFVNIVALCVNLNSKTYASLFSEMNSDASNFITKGADNSGDLKDVTTTMTSSFSGLGQILTFIGAGILVAVISYMGIKYLISPPDKQAALKQQLIGVVVAGIVIFGAYGIWSVMIDIGSKF